MNASSRGVQLLALPGTWYNPYIISPMVLGDPIFRSFWGSGLRASELDFGSRP